MKRAAALALLLAACATQRSSLGEVTSPQPTAASPPENEKPLYKQWWLWTAAGVVLVAGVTIGLSVGLAPTGTPKVQTDFGTYNPF